MQLLARDLIVATQPPQLFERAQQFGRIGHYVANDGANSDLIGIDIGGTDIMARVTRAATRDLSIMPGLPVWALVKAVSLRARAYFKRVPRCKIATMWSLGCSPSAAFTAGSYAAAPVFHITP